MPLPRLTDLLDSGSTATTAGACWIPHSDLALRRSELPPKTKSFKIADGPNANASYKWLSKHGWSASIESVQVGEPSPHRMWEPNPFLEEHFPAGCHAALDMGCGNGRESVLLASEGARVMAIDQLADCLDHAVDLELRYLVDQVPIQWQCGDLREFEAAPGSFDLIFNAFCWYPELISKARTWLRPGGYLIVETFLKEHADKFGKPASHEKVLPPNGLRDLLKGWDLGVYEEGDLRGRITARAVARNLG